MTAPPVGRVHGRAAFAEFKRPDGRARRGPFRVAFVAPKRSESQAPKDCPPAVAYAVGRRCGTAVVRNRLRRRLREAVRADALQLKSGKYLVIALEGAPKLEFSELRRCVVEGLVAAGQPARGAEVSR